MSLFTLIDQSEGGILPIDQSEGWSDSDVS